jgi:hypothetical protein
MAYSYTEVTTESYGERVGGSFTAIVFGFGLLAAGIWFLFWNEGRNYRQLHGLREGIRKVITIASNAINPSYNNELVHVT